MTDDFIWGGFNLRKFCKLFLRNLWTIIAVMIITYLGLTLVDKQTDAPSYTSTAVAAVYPVTSHYRYHTIETISDLSSKTGVIASVINSDMFRSEFHNQYPDLEDFTFDCMQVPNTDLLIMRGTSSNPKNAFEGIRTALESYSRISGGMTGNPEITIILGPKAPYFSGGSRIRSNRARLCVLSGLMMAGLLLFMYVAKRTYKTESSIRKHYKNVRFFSLPFINTKLENEKRIRSSKYSQEPIKKLAIEIKQVLHKCNKKTLLASSYADNKEGTVVLSELARELAEQNEKVILIGTEAGQHEGAPGFVLSDDMKEYTLQDVLQQKCTVKDAMFYSEELKVHCIQISPESTDADFSYSVEDVRRVLSDCLGYGDIILVDGTVLIPSHYAQIWHEAVDASIALCRQEDADFFKVDKMLDDLQKSDTYFTGCVLFGF